MISVLSSPTRSIETREEEHAKDFVTFRLGARRRYMLTMMLGVGGLTAALTGVAPVSVRTVVVVIAAALLANATFTTLATGILAGTWWMRYTIAALDVVLISIVVSVMQQDGLALLYFLIIVPYSFDRGRALGYFTAILSAIGFLLARALSINEAAPGSAYVWPLAISFLLLLVASQVVPITSRLITRIRETREVIAEAESGNLLVRADGRHRDELGLLQESFNRMLVALGHLISVIQHEADEVVSLADQLASATGGLSASSSQLIQTTSTLTAQVATQKEYAAEGTRHTHQAFNASELLHESAQAMESGTHILLASAESSRDSIGRASATLMAIGERVRATAVTVTALGEASSDVGEFVNTVSRIARQTNLLALNAAIEAARAGEHGKGFAVVAEEVRKLAEESGRAAKTVTETITHVRHNIAAVVTSMDEGERDVRGVGDVATEANRALGAILDDVRRIAQLVADTTSITRTQSTTMQSLIESIAEVEQVANDVSLRAGTASSVAAQQTQALHGLSTTSRQLAELADRLRRSVSHFNVSEASEGYLDVRRSAENPI